MACVEKHIVIRQKIVIRYGHGHLEDNFLPGVRGTVCINHGVPLTLSPVRGGHIVPPPVVLYYLKIEGHIF